MKLALFIIGAFLYWLILSITAPIWLFTYFIWGTPNPEHLLFTKDDYNESPKP